MTKLSRMPSGPEFQAHARDLAKAFDVRLIETDLFGPDEALAIPPRRAVLTRTIGDETAYAVALHEIGHLCAALGTVDGNWNLVRVAEEAAWTWARHFALVWTPLMEAVARTCEATYQETPQPPAAPQAPVVPTERINWEHWK